MSTYEIVSLLMSAAGCVTVLCSLFLVYRQTRIFARQTDYVARSLMENLSTNMNNQSHEITRLFIEYPELRPYFYAGVAIEEDHPDYYRAESVAEAILDIFWSMSSQAKRVVNQEFFGREKAAKSLWVDYVSDAFSQSPILVSVLIKRQNWYGEEMVEQMHRSLARANLGIQGNSQPPHHVPFGAHSASGDGKLAHAVQADGGSVRQ